MRLPAFDTQFGCRVALCAAPLLFAACGAVKNGDSKVKIHFPEAPSAVSESVSASSVGFSWARACFSVSVTGSDIQKTHPGACDVPFGVFGGSVAPGGDMTLSVPRGPARKVEVFAYFRKTADETCPAFPASFLDFDRARIALVGTNPSVEVAGEVTVDVTVALPSPQENLLTQYSLPLTCKTAEAAPPITLSSVSSGAARLSGGGFRVDAAIRGPASEVALQGENFKIRLSHKPQ